MSKAFKIEVTYPDGRTKTVTGELGGVNNITAEMAQAHYDQMMGMDKSIHPFPGAKSWRVLPETATDLPGRKLEDKTPPAVASPAPANPAKPPQA